MEELKFDFDNIPEEYPEDISNIDELLDYLINKSQSEITEILKRPTIKLDYKKQRNINNLQLKIKENYPPTISMLKEELRKVMKNNAELVISTFKQMQAKLKCISNDDIVSTVSGSKLINYIDV